MESANELGDKVNFGAYVLSTTDGFSFIPFALEEVYKLLDGKESSLDLNSMLGLQAGHIVMRYQHLNISNVSLYAYSIYQGAQEINAGRDGSFIGVTFLFEKRINSEKIDIGQKLKYFIDGLSELFIINNRFAKKIDIETVSRFCKNDYYKNIMVSIIKEGESLLDVSSVFAENKKIFFYTKRNVCSSFNEICNSNRIPNELYLMSLPNERYISTAKNIFDSVSEWPIPSAKVMPQQSNKSKPQNIQIGQRYEKKQEYRQARRENIKEPTPNIYQYYNIDWESYLKKAGIFFAATTAICALSYFSYRIGYSEGEMANKTKCTNKETLKKYLDKINKDQKYIISKLSIMETSISRLDLNKAEIENVSGIYESKNQENNLNKDQKDSKRPTVQQNKSNLP